MPQSLSLINGQSFTIPEKVATLSIQMWAAGGGGENVADDFTKTAGGDGGNTELLGLKAIGGKGGSVLGGGGGGSGTTTFDWSSIGVTVTNYSGSNGSTPTAGNGALIGNTRYGNGSGGDPGTTTYSSNVYHVFNNSTNTHVVTQSSADLSVSYESPGAADGLSCSPNYNTKHYRIIFNNSFINSNYTLTFYNVCQQAAGGKSTSKYVEGTLDKTSSGFRVWFCGGDGFNGYVRCFSFDAVGQKVGAQGMGGGGGGGVSAFFTRDNLISSTLYAPGTNHTAVVGSGGSGYSGTGGTGRINIQMFIVPTVNLSVTSTSIILGQNVTLDWETTGDADTITWLSGGITNGNLTSNQPNLSPKQTTTYSVQASGDGGTSEISSVTVVVYYPPTASINSTEEINYGDSLYVSYETQYADQSVTITPYYYFVDGTNSVGDEIIVNVASTAEFSKPDSETIASADQLEIPIPWNTVGPESVQVVINAIGTGGTAISSSTTSVYIDITPNNLNVEETPDRIKDEDPIFTPNVIPEEVITSDLYYIDGIDIPIEIKSDFPIQVDINQSGNWKNIREM